MLTDEGEEMSNEFIEEYNAYLAGEISAVETYDLALKNLSTPNYQRALQEGRMSHEERVNKLRAHVLELGGEPSQSSGMWGPFAKFSQGTAGSERDTVALLEESEAERLVNYESQRKLLVGEVLTFLEAELLPAQHISHLTLSTCLKQLEPIPKA
jgi:hypothetical protein